MKAASGRALPVYRVLLWAFLVAYPVLLRGMYLATHIGNPLVARAIAFIGLAGTVFPAALAMFCLHALPGAGLSERARRTVGREAVLGAVSCALFIVVNNGLDLTGHLAWRDRVWWLLLGLVFLQRWLPARRSGFSSAILIRKIHIAAAIPLLLYGVTHIASHLTALYSFEASDAVMDALRVVYRVPVVEIFLLTAVAVQIVSGAWLVSGSRMLSRSTFLRNAEILSGAYLAVFIFAHVVNVVLVGRILHGANAHFSGFTGKGAFGMLSDPNQPRLMPYYFVSVIATFVHVGAAGRWLLIPALGSEGSARFANATMVAGVVAALGILLPMAQIHFGS